MNTGLWKTDSGRSAWPSPGMTAERCELVGREEAAIKHQRRDADQRDGRIVLEMQDDIAAEIAGGARQNGAHRIGRGGKRYPIADRLAEIGDGVVPARGRSVVPQGFVAASKSDMRGTAARGAEDRIVRTARDGRVAATQRDPLSAGAGVDDGVGGTAGNALPRDAADRLVAGAAAGDRVGCGAPDRLVAASAAEDRLMTLRSINELVSAIAADHGVVLHAADRLVVRAAADRITGAGPHRHVAGTAADNRHIAVHRRDENVGAAAAEDRLAGNAADRLVAAIAAGDRVGHGAPDRLVAAAAAKDGLVAVRGIEELIAASAADHRHAGDAADGLVVAAAMDCVAGGGPDRVVAGRAAAHRLIAAGCVDKDIGAATAEGRLARNAADHSVSPAP